MKLAILGGNPIRTEKYPVHTTMVDENEEKAVIEVLRGQHLSGFSARVGDRFLGGEKVREFEERLAEKFCVKYAITFNSATSALHASVAALGIGPGDEVITSPYTMSATASSVLMTSAVPVFADIEDETFGLDPVAVEKLINSNTKAIIAVNIFGHACKLSELKKIADRHKIALIEDNAQAPGEKYRGEFTGTIGEMGILSLNYHKAIQTGEGGVVITNNDDYCEHMRLLRNHGEVVVGDTNRSDITNLLGWNYRLTEIQAAIGIEQLKKMDFLISERKRLAGYLTEKLSKFDFLTAPKTKKYTDHGYYLYPIKFNERSAGISRDLFFDALKAEGLSVGKGYVKPVYLEPIYQQREAVSFHTGLYKGNVDYKIGICPTTERMHFSELLTTDICRYPNGEKEVDEFVLAVEKIFQCRNELNAKI